jgi:N-acetylmuramoyl-L-alanine amidase
VKLLASAAAAACIAAVGAVAGPALSSSHWRPDPVDFELAPGSHAIIARAAHGVTSRSLRPGRRFNLVGMRWRGSRRPAVSLRTRLSDGRWTRWVTVSDYSEDSPDPGRGEPGVRGLSMPVWVGEADQVQYRLSRPVPGLRLHFMNVRGSATPADRVRTAIRRAANTAVASIAGLFRGHAAGAAEPKPAIVPRKAWGADACRPRRAPEYGVVKAALVHHTVSANDYSRAEAPSIVLAICRYHRDSNGWNDIGYNFLVDKYGTIYEGRAGGEDQAVVGAQAQGYNAQTTGIANLGTYTSVRQTPTALRAMARLIRWKLPIHGVPTGGSTTLVSAGGAANKYPAGTLVRVKRVSGHRDVGATECPGDALYAQLPELRRMVGNLAPAGTGTRLRGILSAASVLYKSSSVLTGSLTSTSAAALGGQTVSAQVRRGGRWRILAALTTDPAGALSLVMHPRVNRTMRLRFSGSGDLLPASSPALRLLVRPLVTLTRAPTRGARGKRVRFRGVVAPRKRRLWQVLSQRRHGRWVRVGTKRLTARRGRFGGSFTPERTGRYRYYVVTVPDGSNARGRSALIEISVS